MIMDDIISQWTHLTENLVTLKDSEDTLITSSLISMTRRLPHSFSRAQSIVAIQVSATLFWKNPSSLKMDSENTEGFRQKRKNLCLIQMNSLRSIMIPLRGPLPDSMKSLWYSSHLSTQSSTAEVIWVFYQSSLLIQCSSGSWEERRKQFHPRKLGELLSCLPSLLISFHTSTDGFIKRSCHHHALWQSIIPGWRCSSPCLIMTLMIWSQEMI